MSLYISIKMPSSMLVQSPIDDAIMFMAAHATIEKQQGRIPAGPSLDVTFLLPGEYETPPFVGMRMGGYTRESETLLFEAAVPKHILASAEAPRYVAVVMQDVVEHAHEFFLEHQIDFDAQQWREIVANLTKANAIPQRMH